MKRKREQQRREAEASLDELFEALATNDDEVFEEIVAGLNRRAVLEAAAGRLRAEYVPGDFLLFGPLFERMGIQPVAAELEAIAADEGLEPSARLTAIEALDGPEPGAPGRVRLPAGDLARLADARLREIVLLAPELPEMGEAIARRLADAVAKDEGRALLAQLEPLREELEVPAFTLYGRALWFEETKPLHGDLLDIVTARPSLAARRLLVDLAAGPDNPLLEPALQNLDRALAADLPPAPGTARLSSWRSDGTALLVERPNRDGSLRTAFLELGGDSPRGFAASRRRAELELFASDVATAEIPVEEAAFLVDRELPVEGDHDEEVENAVLLVLDVARLQPPPPLSPPAAAVSREQIEELLDREEYGWYFTPAEFDAADVPPPEEEADVEGWRAGALERLAPEMVPALAARCRFMSRWHLARGEEGDAALLARLALDVESGFTGGDLPALMLERSVDLMTFDDDEDDGDDGGLMSERATRELVRQVARQIATNDPPEVSDAFRRLVGRGASGQDARQQLASALAEAIVEVMASGSDDLVERYVERVRALGR